MQPKPRGRPHGEHKHPAGYQLDQVNRKGVGEVGSEHGSERYVTCSAPRS